MHGPKALAHMRLGPSLGGPSVVSFFWFMTPSTVLGQTDHRRPSLSTWIPKTTKMDSLTGLEGKVVINLSYFLVCVINLWLVMK
jgi:hypothetical protein